MRRASRRSLRRQTAPAPPPSHPRVRVSPSPWEPNRGGRSRVDGFVRQRKLGSSSSDEIDGGRAGCYQQPILGI
ncbi:hypothetical protein EJB05_42941, partial [Eragrostis curvula]